MRAHDPINRTLILGGARSGKSSRALALAEARRAALVFIATAEAGDAEMAARIARHRSERDGRWRTIEAPMRLSDALARESAAATVVVVDCLTLWLSNILLAGLDVDAEAGRLLDAIAAAQGPIILVSNEVGLGLVPETPLGREFRDRQGRLNQAVAAACERVEFIAAGLALMLKGAPAP